MNNKKPLNEPKSTQSIIEEKMKEISMRGNFEMVHLFSSEGLPLAGYYSEPIIEKDRLAEISVLFREIKKMADVRGQISNVKETIVEGYNCRKIIFRFFHAFDQDVVLSIVVPPKQTYRGLANQLVKTIERVSF